MTDDTSVAEMMDESVRASVTDFWNAAKIYVDHPNSINKQVVLGETKFAVVLLSPYNDKRDLNELYESIVLYLNRCGTDKLITSDCLVSSTNVSVKEVDNVFGRDSDDGVFLIVRELIPKKINNRMKYYEIFILDKDKTRLIIYTADIVGSSQCNDSKEEFSQRDPLHILKYRHIELSFSENVLRLYSDTALGVKGRNWLEVVFMPKFINLMSKGSCSVGGKSVTTTTSNKSSHTFSSSSRVDIVQYYKLYEEMKSKYAYDLIQNWTENTDPKKFVYEDIGIATYLMLLWNRDSGPIQEAKRQRFVDLGCGNGLLVHILNSEGHLGVGLDLRKRKIWDTYHSKTVLKEEVIVPSLDTCYPDADWIIGNHSDELTPWLPIMARKSNNHCQYFVLPCCPYKLNGQKFQRLNSGLSSYQDFINYVKGISELCDFETYIDRLRIPSTKRICLIGLRKANSDSTFVEAQINDFVTVNCGHGDGVKEELHDSGGQTSSQLLVKLRPATEKVRNCTKLPKTLIGDILKIVMTQLLARENVVVVQRNGETCRWNRGGQLTVETLAGQIHGDLLKQLKSECKGLQTLLKNHHYQFEVSKGLVRFRSPDDMIRISENLSRVGDKAKWKNRKCWFHVEHPNRCPVSDSVCCYSHD